jgi:putative DNA primase/helicase
MIVDSLKVPDDLGERDQWVLWRRERDTKVPYAIDGRRASTTDPLTWCPLEEAIVAWRIAPKLYAGVGFVFTKSDPFAGIDLDDSLDAFGQVKPWAAGIVERFSDTYMEISPSSRGLKIFARGTLPANVAKVRIGDGGVELYDFARYFTVTGRVFRGAPLEIEDHARDVEMLHGHLTQGRGRWPLQPLSGGRIPHGQQHSTLVSLLGTLRARLVCDEAIEACLQIVNERQCERPGPCEHITRMVRSSRKWSAAE